MALSIDEFLGRLKRRRCIGDGWVAQCPAHDDKKPSLSIKQSGDGKILVYCFTGCTVQKICDAIGVKVSELFTDPSPTNGTGRKAKTKDATPQDNSKKRAFTSTDADLDAMQAALAKNKSCRDFIESRGISMAIAADLRWGFTSWNFPSGPRPALAIPHFVNGTLVGIKLRAIEGEKDFSQVRGSTADGLYGIPNLTHDVVVVFEGPLDCALAMSHGFNAVALNSSTSKITDADVAVLSKFPLIYLVGDMDVAGQQAINDLQKRLPEEKVIRVGISGFKDIGDVYAENPKTFAINLKYILRFARASRDPFEMDDLFTETEIQAGQNDTNRYIVDKLVPQNCITMFFGEEKSGKSMLVSYISKCVANGVFVFGKYSTVKTPVVYLDLENSEADIKNITRQFSRVGPELVRYRTRSTRCPSLDSPGLLRFCKKYRPLLVLDSLTKFSLDADPFNPKEMSQFFDLLLNLCATGATIMVIHHATRDDGERYANSHQIGANVTRLFAVVSEERPTLHRVSLIGKLFRGAEPVSENLIAFPVIEQTGHFGLADFSSVTTTSETDLMVQFVIGLIAKSNRCTGDDVKTRKGYGGSKNMSLLKQAITEKKLVWEKRRGIFVPDALAQDRLRYEGPEAVRTGTNDVDSTDKAI